MISMMNLDIVPNIFLFRETPHYVKTIDSTLDENEKYSLNVFELSKQIMVQMGGDDIAIVHDYVFISFMLGNDFLPHFPALNIRTGGIEKIISAYRDTYEQMIVVHRETKKITICWNSFQKFLRYLARLEEEFIQEEFALREKRGNYKYPENTPENKFRKFENLPSIDRSIEKYINPHKKGWEKRYYYSLFEDSSKSMHHYTKGLAWNAMYYTFGCIDWEWSYAYHYPPLLKDLVNLILNTENIYWSPQQNNISQMEQLCYVLPKSSLGLIPMDVRKKLKKEWYVDDCSFTWAFCKYFWESHVELPAIPFSELRELIKD
jgi:5'-3' exoribonuclease 1